MISSLQGNTPHFSVAKNESQEYDFHELSHYIPFSRRQLILISEDLKFKKSEIQDAKYNTKNVFQNILLLL